MVSAYEIVKRVKEAIQSLSLATWKQLLLGFVLLVLPLLLFIQIADEVRDQDTLIYDEKVLQLIHTVESRPLDTIVVFTTDTLGGVVGTIVISLIVVSVLAAYRQRRAMVFFVAAVVGSTAINQILKLFFQRDRPQLWERLVTENSFSFPSGHAMASASIAVAIMVILWPTKYRYVGIAGGAIYMVYIAFTRMYLGVHYPTDIMAGWLVSSAWVMMAAAIIYRWKLSRT